MLKKILIAITYFLFFIIMCILLCSLILLAYIKLLKFLICILNALHPFVGYLPYVYLFFTFFLPMFFYPLLCYFLLFHQAEILLLLEYINSLINRIRDPFLNLLFSAARFLFCVTGLNKWRQTFTRGDVLLLVAILFLLVSVLFCFYYIISEEKTLLYFFYLLEKCNVKSFLNCVLLANRVHVFIFIFLSVFFNTYVFLFLHCILVTNWESKNLDLYFNRRWLIFLIALIFCLKKCIHFFYAIHFVNYPYYFLYSFILLFYFFMADFIIGNTFFYFSKKDGKNVTYFFFESYKINFRLTDLIFLVTFLWYLDIMYDYGYNVLGIPKELEYIPKEAIIDDFIKAFIPDFEELIKEIDYEEENGIEDIEDNLDDTVLGDEDDGTEEI